jgi:hypothetical protein
VEEEERVGLDEAVPLAVTVPLVERVGMPLFVAELVPVELLLRVVAAVAEPLAQGDADGEAESEREIVAEALLLGKREALGEPVTGSDGEVLLLAERERGDRELDTLGVVVEDADTVCDGEAEVDPLRQGVDVAQPEAEREGEGVVEGERVPRPLTDCEGVVLSERLPALEVERVTVSVGDDEGEPEAEGEREAEFEGEPQALTADVGDPEFEGEPQALTAGVGDPEGLRSVVRLAEAHGDGEWLRPVEGDAEEDDEGAGDCERHSVGVRVRRGEPVGESVPVCDAEHAAERDIEGDIDVDEERLALPLALVLGELLRERSGEDEANTVEVGELVAQGEGVPAGVEEGIRDAEAHAETGPDTEVRAEALAKSDGEGQGEGVGVM